VGLSYLQKQKINRRMVDLYKLELADKKSDILPEDGVYHLDRHPARNCLIGALGGQQDPEFNGPQAHNNLGVVHLVEADKSGKITLSISGQFDITYRVIPTFEEQNEALIYDQEALRLSQQLREAFKRYTIQFDDTKLSFDVNNLSLPHIWSGADEEISSILSSLKDELMNDDRVLRKFEQNAKGFARQTFTVSAAFSSQNEFNDCIYSNVIADRNEMFEYDVQIQGRCRKAPERMAGNKDVYLVEVYLINASRREESLKFGLDLPHLLDSRLVVKLDDGKRIKMRRTLSAAHYRHDSDIWLAGYGVHCSVDEVDDSTLKTETTPVFEQPFVDTPTPQERGMSYSPEFSELGEDPLPFLNDFIQSLELYQKNEWTQRINELQKKSSLLLDEAKKDISQYIGEVDCIKSGVELLNSVPELMLAFKLMNESMAKATKVEGKPFGAWRLFQIGFILTQIKGMFERFQSNNTLDDPEWDYADVLFFATGGGKTEAYFGMIITALFYQRMMGQHYGTCAWIRYPLRMLTAQQFQRLSFVMAQAEKLRVTHNLGGHPFTIGYFTGSGTPNRITDVKNDYFLDNLKSDRLNALQFITVCPYCEPAKRSSVSMSIDKVTARIKHVCNSAECWSNKLAPEGNYGEGVRGEIGIFVSDEECYRYMPSVMVGTLDKLAVVGVQKKCAIFLGSATHFCPSHGFHEGGKCTHYHLTSEHDATVVRCENNSRTSRVRTITVPPMRDRGIAYFLQDELHLLKLNLGAFDSHYESLWSQLQVASGGKPPKVVAATATINAFENHIHHLHMRHARKFPAPGPSLNQSFYAVPRTEDGQDLHRRLHLAILPIIPAQTVNRATALATIRWQASVDHMVQMLRQKNETVMVNLGVTEEYCDKVADYLSRFLNAGLMYANKKADIDNLTRFYRDNCSLLNKKDYLRRLDGETPLEDIQETIRHIDNSENGSPDRTLVATSVVSHGVDMRRLNFLILSGWPNSHAEYLQVSARSGRVEPGVVLNVMAYTNIYQQHLFSGFMEYLRWQDVLVESVPINRIAPNILPRTLPGIICGFILNWGRLQTEWGSNLDYFYAKLHKELNTPGSKCRDALISQIQSALSISDKSVAQYFDERVVADFESQLSDKLKRVFSRLESGNQLWLDPTRNMSIPDVMGEILGHKPFRSLRDIEAQISIKPLNEQEERVIAAIGR
jgi:hypothetical protein